MRGDFIFGIQLGDRFCLSLLELSLLSKVLDVSISSSSLLEASGVLNACAGPDGLHSASVLLEQKVTSVSEESWPASALLCGG